MYDFVVFNNLSLRTIFLTERLVHTTRKLTINLETNIDVKKTNPGFWILEICHRKLEKKNDKNQVIQEKERKIKVYVF